MGPGTTITFRQKYGSFANGDAVRQIRTRTRIDVLRTEQRASPVQWGRRFYLCILTALALFALNWAIGDTFLLRADGLVIADRSVEAATYAARVSRVFVQEGQHVKSGDLLVELQSADMLRDIAQVSAQNADLAERELQLRSRALTVDRLLPLAQRLAQESKHVVGNLDSISNTGLVSSQRLDQALGSEYEAASRLTGLRTESALLTSELPLIISLRERSAASLHQLETFYDDGRIRAEHDGIIGAHVPSPGQVVKVGDELLQVYSGDKRVLAYLPDAYLFSLHPGDRVELEGRQGWADGVVDSLLTVADALPPEFQNTFRPRDRSQLLRIRLSSAENFVVSQKVQVRGCILGWCWHQLFAASSWESLTGARYTSS